MTRLEEIKDHLKPLKWAASAEKAQLRVQYRGNTPLKDVYSEHNAAVEEYTRWKTLEFIYENNLQKIVATDPTSV